MIKKSGINGIVQAAVDNMNAKTERQSAMMDYFAMMCDVDIPMEENVATRNIATLALTHDTAKSREYDTVKAWHDKGMWNITMCRNAVLKGWTTPEEFKEITGEEYESSEE